MNELGLPPHRELPAEVRERMRATVNQGLSQKRQSGGRILAAAAAVVVFVVGAVVVSQFHRSPRLSNPAVAPSPTPNAGDVLARCAAAVARSGKTGVPARSMWVAVAVGRDGDDTVLSFIAAGKPMFCETTATTVTMSDPNATPRYAPGTRTALLLYTDTGLAAGIVDPSWPGVELEISDGPGVDAVDAAGPGKQFTSFTHTDPATTQLVARRYVDRQPITGPRPVLPAAPAPLFSIVDRPADFSSPAGRALTACLNNVSQPPADRGAYTPGALLTDGPYNVVLARAPGHTIVCVAQPDPVDLAKPTYQLYLDNFTGQSIPVRRFSVPALGPNGAKVPFIGIVPPSAVSMIADFGLGNLVNVPVVHGTFALWLPAGATAVYPNGDSWVKASDENGYPLFNGDIPMR